MTRRVYSWLSVLVLLVAARATLAADGNTYARLCITNADGIQVTLGSRGLEPIELAANNGSYDARISGRETLKIELCHKNPVLFTYSAGPLETTPLPDAEALSKFAATVKALTGVFSPARASGGPPPKVKEACERPYLDAAQGIRLDDLRNAIKAVSEVYEKLGANIQLTQNPASPALAAAQKDFAAELADARKQARPLIEKLGNYAAARLTGQSISLQLPPGDPLFAPAYASVERFREAFLTP